MEWLLVEGCPDLRFNKNLWIVKLKGWSKTTFGELTSKKKNLLEEFVVIDLIQESRNLSGDEIIIGAIIIVEQKYLAGEDESIWNRNQAYYD